MKNLSNRSWERRRARAAAGAALLDRLVPSWWRIVRIRELDINDSCNCVTGQLFGDFDAGLAQLRLDVDDARHYGFLSATGDQSDLGLRDLTRHWKNEIRSRRYGDRVGRAS
jgi:hypothetical protein